VVGSNLVRRLQQPEADVTILQAASYDVDLERILRDALRLYPGFSSSVRGRRVVLKPNLVEHQRDHPVNTHPKLVAAAVEVFRSLDAADVAVAEGPGHRRDTELLLEESGLGTALRSVRAKFVDLNLDPIYPVKLTANLTGLKRLWLPRTILDADIVVSMPKMKTHHWVGVTLSMKNLFGVVPGAKYGWPKNVLHWRGIENSILDIALTVRPAFAIVDGVEAMEGDGPIHGRAVKCGAIVVGNNLSAVDASTARIMGIRPGNLRYLWMMLDHGGTINAGRIRQLGESVSRLQRDFALVKEFQYLRKPLTILDFAAGV
jgi:uncharacterized protein (DUF362 family)